ncbi:MAG TPA: medium chain dehydrogenase/reductase family protein [Actinophytocola sp.]|uniref:zinc-dependent alcohol dehydrogenase n=1 Tax=Actinophytocola sp. TaxID=1872138 RepID=UPI002DDD5F78|nr:medium chain dehydrogenase/reductase family protein [Actinophytocola sp.]HEV2778655.1 medium chain dehydrogenase/reductase family protein [Actinophytocola sp.]
MPDPICGPDEILMRTEAVSICSTDVSYYRGHLFPARWPIVPGHEYVGRVVQIGSRLEQDIRLDDRLVYWGQTDFWGMAEFRTIRPLLPQHRLETSWYTQRNFYDADQAAAVVVPAEIPASLATIVEPLTSVLRSLLTNPPRPGDVCVVLGCGPCGLLAVQVLHKYLGAGLVVVADRDPARLRVALELGADQAFNTDLDTTELEAIVRNNHDSFADYLFDALPHVTVANGDGKDVRQLGMGLLRPGGTYVVYGATETPQMINTWLILAKGLRLVAAPFDVRLFPMARSAHVARIALSLIRDGVIKAERLVTRSIRANDEAAISEAFANYGANGDLKTSIAYHDPDSPGADERVGSGLTVGS